MIVSQNRLKIADTIVARSIKNSDTIDLKLQTLYSLKGSEFLILTAVQKNFYQIEPKIVDASCSKYQKFWYLSLDEYKPKQT